MDRLCTLATRCKTEGICATDWFWVDSLCIPKSKELKKAAIAKMSDIYAKASATVVIDESLAHLDVTEVETEAILVRLATAPWNRRMWTLQEGILSNNLHFLINGQLVAAITIMERAMFNALLTPISVQCGLELFDLVKARRQPGYSVGRLMNQLRYRTTSTPGDELWGIGAVMEFDMRQLLDHEGEDRKIQFWKMVKNVPADIVVTASERLTRQGYRWAPSSLLSQLRSADRNSNCVVTDLGLKGEYWTIQFNTRTRVFSQGEESHRIETPDCTFVMIRANGPINRPDGFDCDAIIVEKQPHNIESRYFAACVERSTRSSGIMHVFNPIYELRDSTVVRIPVDATSATAIMSSTRAIQAQCIAKKNLIID